MFTYTINKFKKLDHFEITETDHSYPLSPEIVSWFSPDDFKFGSEMPSWAKPIFLESFQRTRKWLEENHPEFLM
jgi:hypothetical protein